MRRRLPVTLKLATVSAALTFMILLLFATVIGALFQQRLHANFDDDLRATAADLEDQISFRQGSQGQIIFRIDRDTVRAAAAEMRGEQTITISGGTDSSGGGTEDPSLAE